MKHVEYEHKKTNDNNRRHNVIDRGLKPIHEAKHASHSDSSDLEPSNVNDVEERSENVAKEDDPDCIRFPLNK